MPGDYYNFFLFFQYTYIYIYIIGALDITVSSPTLTGYHYIEYHYNERWLYTMGEKHVKGKLFLLIIIETKFSASRMLNTKSIDILVKQDEETN